MGRIEVLRSVLKWSEDLRNSVSLIIIFIGNMSFSAYLAVYFIIIIIFVRSYFLSFYIWFRYKYDTYTFVILIVMYVRFMFRSGYSVSLCCSVYCLYGNMYCSTATGCHHNSSLKIYHNISYHINFIIGIYHRLDPSSRSIALGRLNV
jgi:hypothetical protein